MVRSIAVCVVLAFAALAAYWPATGYGYIEFDDPEYVRDNPFVPLGLNRWGLEMAFKPYHSNWHPLTWLSLMLDAEVWAGAKPGGFHLTNILLHTINVLLLFGVLKAMTSRHWSSAVVAGVFAIHPVHVESVVWIAERKDVLSTTFFLATIAAYVWYVRASVPWARFTRYLIVAALFACALMSKSMVITLPCVLLLLDYWPLGRTSREPINPQSAIPNPQSTAWLVCEKIPLLLMSAATALVTYLVQRPTHALEEGVWIPMVERITGAAVSYAGYLGMLFWPRDLAVLYPNPNLIGEKWPGWVIAGAVGMTVIVTCAVTWLCRKRPYLFVGWLWFVGTMIPVSGLVQFGRQSMADRYAYVPFMGLYIMLAWIGADMIRSVRWGRAIAIPALCVMGLALFGATRAQVNYWRDSETLFTHAIKTTDNNWMMHRNLAGVLEQGRTEEALSHMRAALEIFPDCAWLHDHYAAMLGTHGQLFEAQQELEKAIALDPNYARAYFNLAVILLNRGRGDESLRTYERAVQVDPHFPEAWRNLALLLASQNRMPEAVHRLEQAQINDPDNATIYQILIQQVRSQYSETGGSR